MNPALQRAACWGGFLFVVTFDAAVASPISLGLLYFVPLVATALLLSMPEAVAMAVLSSVARYFFGPTGDPLGISSAAYHLVKSSEPLANALVSALAYAGATLLVLRLRAQREQIFALGIELERDPLTGLRNRRVLAKTMVELTGRQLALVSVDLDHFKRVNDTFGHGAGDEVLIEAARRLLSSTRGGDLVVRTGGEEFVVILPGATLDAAAIVAERILEAIRGTPFTLSSGEKLALTTSVGVATGPASDSMLEESDAALYRAKTGGRNRVEYSRGEALPADGR